MKKIIVITAALIFAFATTSYAGINNIDPSESSGSSIYGNSSGTAPESSDQSFSLFENSVTATPGSSGGIYRDSPAPGPGDRPGSGGIGQDETPIGDGLDVLVESCILFGIGGVIKERHKIAIEKVKNAS